MTRFLAIADRLSAFSNFALLVGMIGLFTTTFVLIVRNKTERD